MSDIESSNWSETAASNNASSPNGWASGTMIPSQVEPTAREMMAALKRDWDHKGPTVTSGGAANVQTLTYSVAPAAYVQGQIFTFIAGFTNTSTATLNVNALGAKAVQLNALALAGGEIVSGTVVIVAYDGTQFQLLGKVKKPTRQIFTSGSGTYTKATSATMLRVRMLGGGGAGGGNGTSGQGAGGNGGNSTFSTFTAAGGTGGGLGNAGTLGAGSAGGTASGSPDASWAGGSGASGSAAGGSPAANQVGGAGGQSTLGASGAGTTGNGNAGAVNSGSGGAGAGGNASTFAAGGGGAGATVDTVIINPAATYSYGVGAGGTAGAVGTSGSPGGAGGSGIIIVEELYN